MDFNLLKKQTFSRILNAKITAMAREAANSIV